MNNMEMFTETVMMTPELANYFLSRMITTQRPERPTHIRYLTEQIISNQWRLTHQGICVSKSGNTLDGQHRLKAVVAASKTVPMRVTYNVDDNAFEAIDLGSITRAPKDVLFIEGDKQGGMKQMIARAMKVVDTGKSYKIDLKGVRDFCKRYEKGIEYVCQYNKHKVPAYFGAAIVYAYDVAPSMIEVAVEKIISRNTFVGEAEHAIRWVIGNDNAGTGLAGRNCALKIMRGFEHLLKGEACERLLPSDHGYKFLIAERKRRGLKWEV